MYSNEIQFTRTNFHPLPLSLTLSETKEERNGGEGREEEESWKWKKSGKQIESCRVRKWWERKREKERRRERRSDEIKGINRNSIKMVRSAAPVLNKVSKLKKNDFALEEAKVRRGKGEEFWVREEWKRERNDESDGKGGRTKIFGDWGQ